MKIFLSCLSLIFMLFACSSSDEEKPKMVLKCKFNSDFLYEDTFKFFEDNSVVMTSSNSSVSKQIYKLKVKEDLSVLTGDKSITKNGMTEIYPDSEIYVLINKNIGNWTHELYYRTDFETDPFRWRICRKII